MGQTSLNVARWSLNPTTKNRLPFCRILCPSSESLCANPAVPPGYFGFNSPFDLSVRQNGVVLVFPSDSASAAACAAIHEKIPMVSGHAIVAPCLRARTLRSSSIVVTLPRGTWRMSWSTSIGAGITNVPVPHRLLLAASMGQTLGSPLLSASFSCQLFFLSFIPLSPTRRADRVPSIGMTYYFRGAGWPSTPAGGCSMAYWSSSRSSFFRR